MEKNMGNEMDWDFHGDSRGVILGSYWGHFGHSGKENGSVYLLIEPQTLNPKN